MCFFGALYTLNPKALNLACNRPSGYTEKELKEKNLHEMGLLWFGVARSFSLGFAALTSRVGFLTQALSPKLKSFNVVVEQVTFSLFGV